MRLKLNYEKVKTYILMFVITFFVSAFSLCLLRLDVLAADSVSGRSTLPLPFGYGSHFGFSSNQLSLMPDDDEISDIVDYVYNYNGSTVYGLFIYEIGSDYVLFDCFTSDFWFQGNDYPNISSTFSTFNLRAFGSAQTVNYIRVKFQNGSVSFVSSGRNSGSVNYFSNGVVPADTYIFYYPFWYVNGDIVYSQNFVANDNNDFIGFEYYGGGGSSGGASSLGSGIGTIKDFDGQGFDIDFDFFLDLNPLKILGEEIRDGVFQLGEYISDGFDIVVGKIGELIGYIRDGFNIVSGYVEEIVDDLEKPSQQQLQEALQNSTVVGGVVGVVSNAKGVIDTLFSDFVEVPSAEDMEFDIDFVWRTYFFNGGSDGWVLHHTPIHISFAWYESIRSSVTLVITVFMSIGFLMYFIKQIPNLIAGVSGGASAGQSIADFNSNRGGDKK